MTTTEQPRLATMADRFRLWYAHERVANGWIVEMLGTVPEDKRSTPEFRRAIELAAHLATARRMWLFRLGVWPSNPGGWFVQDVPLAELPRMFADTEAAWVAYLEKLDDAQIARVIEWQGLDGHRYRWPLEFLLTQVSGHAWHHRGQITQLVGMLGGKTRSTDFFFWNPPQRVEPR